MSIDFGDTRLPERFWDKVFPEPNSGCWLWSGSIDSTGAGQIQDWTRRSPLRSYIAIARVAFVDFSDFPLVCHICDVRECCNPDHLYMGTSKDNAQDMVRRGRENPHGRKLATCKLNHALDVQLVGERVCSICRGAQARNAAIRQRSLKGKVPKDDSCNGCFYAVSRCKCESLRLGEFAGRRGE